MWWSESNRQNHLTPLTLPNPPAVIAILEQLKPEEIYYLVAFHHSAEDPAINDHNVIARSFEVNTLSLDNFLYEITENR